MSYEDFPTAPRLEAAFYEAHEGSPAPAAVPSRPEKGPFHHPIHHHDLSEWAPSPGGPLEQSVHRSVVAAVHTRQARLHEESVNPHGEYLRQIDDAQERMMERMEAQRNAREEREELEAYQETTKSQQHGDECSVDNPLSRDAAEAWKRWAIEHGLSVSRDQSSEVGDEHDAADDLATAQSKDREQLGIDHGPGFYGEQGDWNHEAEGAAERDWRASDGLGQFNERSLDGWDRTPDSDDGHDR